MSTTPASAKTPTPTPTTTPTPFMNTSPSPFWQGGTTLPVGRVKTIMKSSPDVEAVSQESLFLVTKATELFVMYLSKLAQRNGDDERSVTYHDLADVVQKKDSMEFLHDILPHKIKFADYLEAMKKEQNGASSADDSLCEL